MSLREQLDTAQQITHIGSWEWDVRTNAVVGNPDDSKLKAFPLPGGRIGVELENQLRDLSAHLEQAREEERSALARELHDVFGQALTALKLDIAWIARRSSGEILEKTRAMSELGDRLIADARRISTELRPRILDIGLLPAFEWQAAEFSSRSGTRCDVRSNVGDLAIDRNISTALFRILHPTRQRALIRCSARGRRPFAPFDTRSP